MRFSTALSIVNKMLLCLKYYRNSAVELVVKTSTRIMFGFSVNSSYCTLQTEKAMEKVTKKNKKKHLSNMTREYLSQRCCLISSDTEGIDKQGHERRIE